jgi:hypothetical protein
MIDRRGRWGAMLLLFAVVGGFGGCGVSRHVVTLKGDDSITSPRVVFLCFAKEGDVERYKNMRTSEVARSEHNQSNLYGVMRRCRVEQNKDHQPVVGPQPPVAAIYLWGLFGGLVPGDPDKDPLPKVIQPNLMSGGLFGGEGRVSIRVRQDGFAEPVYNQ